MHLFLTHFGESAFVALWCWRQNTVATIEKGVQLCLNFIKCFWLWYVLLYMLFPKFIIFSCITFYSRIRFSIYKGNSKKIGPTQCSDLLFNHFKYNGAPGSCACACTTLHWAPNLFCESNLNVKFQVILRAYFWCNWAKK